MPHSIHSLPLARHIPWFLERYLGKGVGPLGGGTYFTPALVSVQWGKAAGLENHGWTSLSLGPMLRREQLQVRTVPDSLA